MNLGQLVRSKMKELNADKSGEYIDERGSHFKMSAEGEGYAISYGGGKSVSVTREQGTKLASHSRKLEAERKELAAWSTQGSHAMLDGQEDAQGSVHDEGDGTFTWSVMNKQGKIIAQGEANSQAQAKSAVEQKMNGNALLSGGRVNLGYQEVMAGVTKAQALQFMDRYNKYSGGQLMDNYLSIVNHCLAQVGIQKRCENNGTANAVVTRMEKKAGVW